MPPRAGIWHRALVAMVLVAGGIAVAFAIGEALARLTWRSPTADAPAAATTPPSDLPELKTLFELATPNVRGIFKGRFYRANSAGFRGPEYTETPPPGVFRIVIVHNLEREPGPSGRPVQVPISQLSVRVPRPRVMPT